jgi:solute carrier family 39 (zinc transporter), member 9
MCLLLGFTLMLAIENLLAPHSHSSPSGHRRLKTTDSASPPLLPRNSNDHDRDHSRSGKSLNRPSNTEYPPSVVFSAEDEDVEHVSKYSRSTLTPRNGTPIPLDPTPKSNPNLLTLGLVVHSLADGLALGSSFISVGDQGSSLSFIVFLAIIIHKGPYHPLPAYAGSLD